MTPKDNSFHTHHTTNRSLRSVQVPPPPKEHSPQYSAHICCGQMAWWIKMPLGRRVGFDPSDIVWGSSYPSPKGGRAPQFSAHVYCGQTAAWIKMLLGMEIGLGPGHIVLYGDPAPLPKKRRHSSCLLWPNGRPSQLLLSTFTQLMAESTYLYNVCQNANHAWCDLKD